MKTHFNLKPDTSTLNPLYQKLEKYINEMNLANTHDDLERMTLEAISCVLEIYDQNEIVLDWNDMGK